MAKVQILPQVLAHQIAAGEIVERPSSVVKELVENALDAEATRIHVMVEEGGKRRIQVTDDGYGMTAEDASLAFEHHATSKISEFEDLMRISTLGFRGEALPSIASVSRTLLRTVDRESVRAGSPLGTEIRYVGGELKEITELTWPEGTEICVEDLFFNVPARRKFLKTVSTELSHIGRLVMCYALAYPDVEFKLEHEGRSILDAVAVDRSEDRVYQLLGKDLSGNLVPIAMEREGISIAGFASLPHEQRNNANSLYLFVNRRMVRDRVLTHAIRMAYRDLIPSAAYPVAVLFVEIEPRLIDVNVHPTKNEIRFRDSQKVHSTILHSIEEGLLLHRSNLSNLARDIPLRQGAQVDSSRAENVRRSVERFFSRSEHRSFPFSAGLVGGGDSVDSSGSESSYYTRPPESSGRDSIRTEGIHADLIPETAHLSEVPVILGQFVESFVIAVDREGVMLIDQHVAHERILYDRALRSFLSEDPVPSQRLLLPATIELTPQEMAVAGKVLDRLNEDGFEVEWFGSSTVVVKAVPALVRDVDAAEMFRGLLHEIDQLGNLGTGSKATTGSLDRVREQVAISVSCQAAIKINTPLSEEKMQWLVDELFKCDNPYTCPHGRPVVLRLNVEEILRGFKRI